MVRCGNSAGSMKTIIHHFTQHFLLPWIIRLGMRVIGFFSKIIHIEGKDTLDDIIKNKKPVIFSFWHNRIFFASHFLHQYVFRKGVHLTVLISQSKDGEFIARVVEGWGGTTARGSATRGGKEAMHQIFSAVKKKSAIVTTPDGPRGPVYDFKAGTMVIAQLTQIPIIPVSFAAKPAWVLNSWDKFVIPKFFSKIVISIGDPIYVPRKLNEQEKETYRASLQKEMMKNLETAEQCLRDRL